ncbi:S8 family serine peptidase [Pseudoalteromonas shioyasakiensis]|uniref:S8 family serine peptidase n=1 Tax=Pseudoalteromonas shioyasakiensis TaxID=1190813 RepID=UPI002551D618|nr:S8 family serine peptidase [Pseudoalteromonas shioyasakiensis]MDK9683256.1 S8 family serine peptidase [Pseudoalteromonas shioyasakiensis]
MVNHSLNKRRYSVIAVIVASSLSACGNSDSDNSNTQQLNAAEQVAQVKNNYEVNQHDIKHWLGTHIPLTNGIGSAQDSSVTVTQFGKQINAVNNQYQTENGFFSIHDDNTIVYVATGDKAEQFIVTFANAKQQDNNTVSIANIISDPLVAQQWHLENTGQLGYARQPDLADHWRVAQTVGLRKDERSVEENLVMRLQETVTIAGEDMNVKAAYGQGITGKNEIVVVVDSGLEILHEDLIDNVLPNRSLNFNVSRSSATDPTSYSMGGDHGTSVAGLIASTGWNGLGGRGVAPDSKLIGMNFIGRGIAQTDQNNMISHGLQGSGIQAHERIAAFNRSYGRDLVQFSSFDKIDEAISLYPAKYLRNGQGTLNVKSSGNSFKDSRPSGTLCEHTGANELGLTCSNTLFESDLNYPHYIAVGALNADGRRSSYSSAGPNMFISAPAGERGDWEPAMITADQMTCLRGYAGNEFANFLSNQVYAIPGIAEKIYPFNAGAFAENAACHYTNTFNGTSSAAPNTSGVVALILSANPQLHWRDVKHILLASADQNDIDDQAISIAAGNGSFQAHDGWVTNAAGYPFNNQYGFGRVNAGEAVKMALNYHNPLPTQITTDWLANTQLEQAKIIPDNNATGLEITINVEHDMTIEAVQFDLAVFNDEFKNMGVSDQQSTAGIDLAIEVTSPSGTRNVLLSSKQALLLPQDFTNQANRPSSSHGFIINGALIASNAFYGENAKGEWRLRFIDTSNQDINSASPLHNGYINNSVNSELQRAAIRIVGY